MDETGNPRIPRLDHQPVGSLRPRRRRARHRPVRYPRLVAKDDKTAADLKKRTLTNLYNQRPTWLDLAHKKLDAAVFASLRLGCRDERRRHSREAA